MAIIGGVLLNEASRNVANLWRGNLSDVYSYSAIGVGDGNANLTLTNYPLMGSNYFFKNATIYYYENSTQRDMVGWDAIFNYTEANFTVREFAVVRNVTNGTMYGLCRFRLDDVLLDADEALRVQVFAKLSDEA